MSDAKGENIGDNAMEDNGDVTAGPDADVTDKEAQDNPPMTSGGAEFPLISFEETARIERIITAHKNRESLPKVSCRVLSQFLNPCLV